MIKKLIRSNRMNVTILLLILSLACFGLSVFRVLFSHSYNYLSLNWNLFLAFIPWAISSIIIINNLQNKKRLLAILILSWVVFFPNSPYIITDLFHLRHRGGAPLWFDLVLILSFAWTGLLFGISSLMDIEKVLHNYMSKSKTMISTIIFLFVSSYGIYIGRYLRWNSWDIIVSPFALSHDIVSSLIHPTYHMRAWGTTLFIGILLNLIYFSFKFIVKESSDKITFNKK